MVHHLPTTLALAAALLCAASAQAQEQAQPSSSLPTVSVSGRNSDAPVTVGGFGDTPVAKLPFQAQVLNSERLADAGIQSLAGITRMDASISDAYNSVGYVSYLKVRGYDLDNRFNYRRDGLPINAETALALGNTSSIEVLKGLSGMQAGTSSPGGLVNLVVKRPTSNLLAAGVALSERGTAEVFVDWSRRFGEGEQFGLRVNASAASLNPEVRNADGDRQLLALASDMRVNRDLLVEAELEFNRQSQPSQGGMSLLGNTLPSAKDWDPRRNLNNMPWSQPVVFENTQGSLRVQQQLGQGWKAQAHYGFQRIKTDDRLAYAYGCSAEGNYDRFCSNGNFDRYDYRSEGEHRDGDALDLSLQGQLQAAGLEHSLTLGVLGTQYKGRFHQQAYNLSGQGNVYTDVITPADPSLTNPTTKRSERTAELYVRDAIRIDAHWQAFLGLRHTRLTRDAIGTDGSNPTHYSQSLNSPWAGLSYALSPQLMAYASWGQGMESDVAPNKADYSNQGQALPAAKSRQTEFGVKSGSSTVDWSLAWFNIERPQWNNIGACTGAGGVNGLPPTCTRQLDGQAHHQGIEAQADLKWNGGGLQASAMKLRARIEGSATASLNGSTPTNVPETSLKLQARQNLLPGLQGQMGLVYEGPRAVLPDNSISIGGWTRLDAGLRYEHNVGRQLFTWRLGVDNLADRRAWRESPYQYGHAYLYPIAPRTARISFETLL